MSRNYIDHSIQNITKVNKMQVQELKPPYPKNYSPVFIFTTRGNFPACLLRHESVTEDYPEATIYAEEYYIGAELVKRSLHAALKSKELLVAQSGF